MATTIPEEYRLLIRRRRHHSISNSGRRLNWLPESLGDWSKHVTWHRHPDDLLAISNKAQNEAANG
jgi:hypothetical protein